MGASGAAALALAALVVAQRNAAAEPAAFERRLADGCDGVEACQALERLASERWARCALLCARERDDLRRARQLVHRAEERRRVREHYRASAELERRARAAARAERELAALRSQAAERELEEHRQRLAREREREARRWRRRAELERREREITYLRLLSAEHREQRLARCHGQRGACGDLLERLLEAASDDPERRALAAANERFLERRAAEGARPSRQRPPPSTPTLTTVPERPASTDRREGCASASGACIDS